MDSRTSTSNRAWIRLPSGAHLNLLNPDPWAWTDEDLAKKISRTYRWAGESKWSEPLSVAQHSLAVLALRQQRSPHQPLSREQALMELLHDAEEAFLGFDCISPLKAVLGEPMQHVSQTLVVAISRRYGLLNWSDDAYEVHKQADLQAAASEAVHVVGWSVNEVRETLNISADILMHDPLEPIAHKLGLKPWQPWPADTAARMFLIELRSLTLGNKVLNPNNRQVAHAA